MNAVVIRKVGGVEALELADVPRPDPMGGEVRVRVAAAGLNRADLMQARGHYPPPPGAPRDIPGLEYAGVVDAIGPGCVGPLKPGDRVFGIVSGGGLAEFVTTHERMAVPIPANLDFDAAAAIPEAFLTAQDALETQGRAAPGNAVLIHAAAGGVGSAAVQIAHAMGCLTIGTTRSAKKAEPVARLGADRVIVGPFAEEVRSLTGGRGVDVILDHIGAPGWDQNLESLATKGRLVIVGLLGGAKVQADLMVLLRKRLTVVGTTLRARPLEEKIAVTRRFAESVVPWLASGKVRPVVDRVYPIAEIHAAQERLESNAGFGKIVVRF